MMVSPPTACVPVDVSVCLLSLISVQPHADPALISPTSLFITLHLLTVTLPPATVTINALHRIPVSPTVLSIVYIPPCKNGNIISTLTYCHFEALISINMIFIYSSKKSELLIFYLQTESPYAPLDDLKFDMQIRMSQSSQKICLLLPPEGYE